MYGKCCVPVILNRNYDGTAFTRTVVTRSISTLLRCMAHQFEAEDLSKLVLPINSNQANYRLVYFLYEPVLCVIRCEYAFLSPLNIKKRQMHIQITKKTTVSKTADSCDCANYFKLFQYYRYL